MATRKTMPPHTVGCQLTVLFYLDPLSSLLAVPVTINLDKDDGLVRHTLRYLNGGADGVPEDSDRKIRFTKTSAWSAANMTPGMWTVSVAWGDDGTTQQEIVYGPLAVVERPGGPLPTTNP